MSRVLLLQCTMRTIYQYSIQTNRGWRLILKSVCVCWKQGRWPNLERWFTAMEGRDSYIGFRSDYYTHCHDLPPQLGGTVACRVESMLDVPWKVDELVTCVWCDERVQGASPRQRRRLWRRLSTGPTTRAGSCPSAP